MRHPFLIPCALWIALLAPAALAEPPEEEDDDAAVFWVGESVTLASQRGKAVVLEPGLYRVERTEGSALLVRGDATPKTIALPTEEVATEGDDTPGGVRLVPTDAGTLLRYTHPDGRAVQVRLHGGEVRTRSIWIPMWPDLRASVDLPDQLYSGSDFSATVTLRNPGRGPASSIAFRVHLRDSSRAVRWATYRSASSRRVSCSQDSAGTLDCTYQGRIDPGSTARFRLRFRVASSGTGTRNMQVHADCSPSAWHSRGGAIKELSESNNVSSAAEARVRPKPNLRSGITSTVTRDGRPSVPKNQITALHLIVSEASPTHVPVSEVKVVATLASFDIHRVEAPGDFRCSFSNSTHKVTCVGGTLPTRLTSTQSTWAPRIRVHVMPKGSAPIAPTPVMAHVDPDGRIPETNETDNLKTTNLYITP